MPEVVEICERDLRQGHFVTSAGDDLQEDRVAFELERLQGSIDRLTETVVDLKENAVRQTAATQALSEKQNADFRSLLLLLQDNFAKLVDRQDAAFRSLADRQDATFKILVERQDASSKAIMDRLDASFTKVIDRQDASATSLLDRQDASFKNLLERQDAAFKSFGDRLDKLVDRQDSHFRWLAGLIVASALSLGLAFVRLAH